MNLNFSLNHKAQITAEFMIVLVLVFSLFTYALFIYNEKNTGLIYSKEFIAAKQTAFNFAREINKVYQADGNVETTLFAEYDFNYSVSGRQFYVRYRSMSFSAPLMTDQITFNSLSAGKLINIKKQDLNVVIENAE